MGLVRKPIINSKWFQTKKPTLQIKILKSILTYGQLSKTSASRLLNSDYKDVSDAINALINHKFIVLRSNPIRKTKKGRAEELYRMSISGLRALFIKEVMPYLLPTEFWKLITILNRSDRTVNYENEFDLYYNLFETDRIGFSSTNMHCYLLELDFIHNIFQVVTSTGEPLYDSRSRSSITDHLRVVRPSLHQTVLECLALNGPLTDIS